MKPIRLSSQLLPTEKILKGEGTMLRTNFTMRENSSLQHGVRLTSMMKIGFRFWILVCCLFLIASTSMARTYYLRGGQKFITPPSPTAIFVDGYNDCCIGYMSNVFEELNSLGIPYRQTSWNSFNSNNTGGHGTNDQAFIDGLIDWFKILEDGTPVILIGHSFGGDSILKALDNYRRSKPRIMFVGVIDPVGLGGLRSVVTSKDVPSQVEYFFNRWQNNYPWPVDFPSSGSVSSSARINDQKAHNKKKDQAGNNINKFNQAAFKKTSQPTTHQGLTKDEYIQQQIIDTIQVQFVYHDILGRAVESESVLQGQRGFLREHGYAQFRQGIAHSAEAQARVEDAFQTILGHRSGNTPHWATHLGNVGYDRMVNDIRYSPEGISQHGR